jgi:DNA-binding response OmpR family regulator
VLRFERVFTCNVALWKLRVCHNCWKMRVLIVEDEKKMAQLLKKGLEEESHSASLAYDGATGLEMAEHYEFDAIVLDIMLPGIDGFEVARRLRRSKNQTPILILTARDAVPDVVKGLDVGADDYLTKPFAFDEFLARLRSVARRGFTPRPVRLQVADLTLNPATHQVFRGNQEIRLTPTEYRLLDFLIRRAGRVVPRNTLVEAVWGFDQDVEENTLDAFVRLLRSKVDRDFKHKLIHTVRGVGYSIREIPEP